MTPPSSSPPGLADRLADTTLELVSIPSESGEEQALTKHVSAALESMGPAHLVRGETRLAALFGCTPDSMEECVLLAGHLDTVPRGGHPGPKREKEDVWGRGASDMKGAVAVMLELARDFDSGGRPLGLILYDCEETAFERNGLRKLLAAEPWLGGAEAALLMEPTDNEVQLGCMGTLHAKVTFHGRAAHSARPWQGENAIHKAGDLLSKLAASAPREVKMGPAVYKEVVNATMASGGISRNVIPDVFTVNVNFRFPPDRTGEEAAQAVRDFVGDKGTVDIVDVAPAAPPTLEAPVLKRLADAFGLKVTAKQAWTDICQLSDLGVPAVNFGPGAGAMAHQQNESVPVKNLVRSYEIVRQLLQRPGKD